MDLSGMGYMASIESLPLALFRLSVGELVVIGIFALLIFGNRLPEIGRNIGRTFVEFKKGLKDGEGNGGGEEGHGKARGKGGANDEL